MISDEEFLLLYDGYSSQPENQPRPQGFSLKRIFLREKPWGRGCLRKRVLKSVTAAQERLDMRSGCHAEKILPVGVRGTKNVWCLSSLLLAYDKSKEKVYINYSRKTSRICFCLSIFYVFACDSSETLNHKAP